MKDIQLVLTDPCLKQWEDMKPLGDGRYCASCNKTVVDLSSKTDVELIQFFKNKADNVCGRLLSSQLNRKLIQPRPDLKWHWMVPMALSAMAVLPTNAQELKPVIIQSDKTSDATPLSENSAVTISVSEDIINGLVMDSKTSTPLKGVKIRQIGFENVVATTDVTGRFKINATEDNLKSTFIFEMDNYARAESTLKTGMVMRLTATKYIRLGGVSLAGVHNEPLYLIRSGKKSCYIDGAKMKELSPDSIENIEVLRDIKATALYGLRAANGIIIIDIKKAYAKKFDFSTK